MRASRLLLMVYVGVAVVYGTLLAGAVAMDHSWREDFTAFYTGWTVSLSPDRGRLYDLDTQRRYQAHILARDGRDSRQLQDGILPYLNPPHATVLFAPLALIPRKAAFTLWTLAQLALLIPLWRSLRFFRMSTTERRLAFGAAVSLPLIVIAVGVGAFSLLVTVAVLRAYLAAKEGRDVSSALWLAAATVKPQAALFSIAALLVWRGWKLFAPLACALAASVFTSAAAIGLQPFVEYPRLLNTIANSEGRMSVLTQTTATFRGVLFVLFGYESAAWINPLALAAFIAALFCAVWAAGRRDDISFALAVALGLVFGTHVNPVDDLLLCVAALILYARAPSRALAGFCLLAPLALFAEWRLTQMRPFSVVLNLIAFSLLCAAALAAWCPAADPFRWLAVTHRRKGDVPSL